MIRVNVCIGSSCHLKGSRLVIETLQSLLAENGLADEFALVGTFCMGNCTNGVCLQMNEKSYSVGPSDVEALFEKEMLGLYLRQQKEGSQG